MKIYRKVFSQDNLFVVSDYLHGSIQWDVQGFDSLEEWGDGSETW